VKNCQLAVLNLFIAKPLILPLHLQEGGKG